MAPSVKGCRLLIWLTMVVALYCPLVPGSVEYPMPYAPCLECCGVWLWSGLFCSSDCSALLQLSLSSCALLGGAVLVWSLGLLQPLVSSAFSMIAISFLNGQHSCSSFCASAFVDGQLWRICSDRIPRCLLSRVATLYLFCSHVFWYVHAWLHCIDGFVHTWYFFITLCLLVVSGKPICNE